MRKHLFILILIPVIISCEGGGIVNSNSRGSRLRFDRETFNQKRQLWLEQDIQHYSFEQLIDRRYPGIWITVIVKNGKRSYFRSDHFHRDLDGNQIEELFLPGEFLGYVPFHHYELQNSVPEIFNFIEFLANTSDSGITTIDVQYDSKFHYPAYIYYLAEYPDRLSRLTMYITDFILAPNIPEETSFSFDRNAFNINRQQWGQDNKNYSFYFSYSGEFILPITAEQERDIMWVGIVTVKDGIFHDVKPAHTWTRPEPISAAQAWITTIDGVFAKIEEAADQYVDGGFRIDIDYDEEAGYPRRVRFVNISPDSPEENWAFTVKIRMIDDAAN